MKRLISLLLILLLLCTACAEKENDTPRFSTKKANDDFSDLFELTDSRGDALAAVTVTAVEEVTDIVEKYEVYTTDYTRITATVDQEFTDQIQKKEITILLLGTAAGFPQREQFVRDRSYVLRLESWVHETGIIYLVSPLESAYLRIFEGEILVHENAADLNYKKALTVDAFAKQYQTYRAQNPPSATALAEHYEDIRQRLSAYDYQNKELSLKLTDAQITARKDLAEQLS